MRPLTPNSERLVAASEIGSLQAQVRGAHLQSHPAQMGILTPEQNARHAQLRGNGALRHSGTTMGSTSTSIERARLFQSAHSEEITMSDERAAPETKGVTVKLLSAVDLGPEIEGMAGRQLRMRMVTIEPGGVFGPVHDHKGRPGTVYILQGTITDHRNGIATDYGPGVGWPEDRNTTHWLENRGPIPAVEISVDIVRQE